MTREQIFDFKVLAILGLISTVVLYICMMPLLGSIMGLVTLFTYSIYARGKREFEAQKKRQRKVKKIINNKDNLIHWNEVVQNRY